MNQSIIRAAHATFAASLWGIFGLCLWRMDFSPRSIMVFGQQLSNNSVVELGQTHTKSALTKELGLQQLEAIQLAP